MWDRFFRERAYIGITRSHMRWYVRKKSLVHELTAYLTLAKVGGISIPHIRTSPRER